LTPITEDERESADDAHGAASKLWFTVSTSLTVPHLSVAIDLPTLWHHPTLVKRKILPEKQTFVAFSVRFQVLVDSTVKLINFRDIRRLLL
jgi:hypothetical protein